MVVGLVVGNRQSRPWIVSDELWSLIEPLLPVPGPKLVEGRPRVPDRQALCGILFVLHTGIQWEYLPQELGFGSGMTCWRRLAAWNEAGVWEQLHLVLLKKLRAAKKLECSPSSSRPEVPPVALLALWRPLSSSRPRAQLSPSWSVVLPAACCLLPAACCAPSLPSARRPVGPSARQPVSPWARGRSP
jgi:transposase